MILHVGLRLFAWVDVDCGTRDDAWVHRQLAEVSAVVSMPYCGPPGIHRHPVLPPIVHGLELWAERTMCMPTRLRCLSGPSAMSALAAVTG